MRINYVIIFFALFIVVSCNESKRKIESVPETVIESSELENYSDKFKKLMITEDGVLRGFTFITDSSEIRRNENADLLSFTPEEITYTIAFNELEMGDIIYHLKGNEIDTFEVDLYLKNKESTDTLLNDFKNYYTSKYGQIKFSSDSLITWKDSINNIGVKLNYIDRDVDHGLNVYLFKNREEKKIIQ